jgi:hypothetical protein
VADRVLGALFRYTRASGVATPGMMTFGGSIAAQLVRHDHTRTAMAVAPNSLHVE